MSRKRRMFFKAAHRDKAERAIIDALKAAGASVHQVSGKDIPDLLVGFRGVTYLLEVKSRLLSEEKGRAPRMRTTKVSEGQQEFLAAWKGGPARVVHTPEEALKAVGAPVEGALEPLGSRPFVYPSAVEAQRGVPVRPLPGEPPLRAHGVTPAFQREQTEAVTTKRRKKP